MRAQATAPLLCLKAKDFILCFPCTFYEQIPTKQTTFSSASAVLSAVNGEH